MIRLYAWPKRRFSIKAAGVIQTTSPLRPVHRVAHCGTHLIAMPATATRRSSRLVARVTSEDKALLERAAGIEGCSVAMFVVSRVREAAEKVVQRHQTVRLNQAESQRFVRALLAPARPATKRMREALALHRKTVSER